MASNSHGGTARAILYAFLANGGIALAKTWAAMVTGSGSMLAEAIHSYADTGNQVLLFLGLKQSAKPADKEHPLGYGKLSYFWSFVVALMLFSLGGLFSIYEGVHKLQHPEPLTQVWIAIAVLSVAIVLESFSLAGCLREINLIRGGRPFRAWLKHTRNSELVVVLGEDVAALLGLILALIFVSLAAITGNGVYDAIGSMCIGAILIVISVFLTIRVQSLLVGRSADPMVQEAIDAIIRDDEDIEKIYNAITMQFGPDTLLAAKIKLKSGIDIDTAVARINDLERRLKEEVPGLKWCFIEPDVAD
ncbi:MAG: cation diffusion facilitator family transporter [Gammaproteobacteria bacterium]|nr:cation diffusion facilitator family transporter [Gammaproteobacteria bacterium]